MFTGGMLGSEAGGHLGELGDAVGLVAGASAGAHAADAASGLPEMMLVGVSASTVYGFEGRSRRRSLHLLFRVERAGLDVEVHGRINVRVLELVHQDTGSRSSWRGTASL